MRLVIAAIGKRRSGPEIALVDDYIDRAQAMGRRIGFSAVEHRPVEASKALSGAALKKREAELLISAAGDDAQIIALDERGENLSSEELAAYLGRRRDEGVPAAAFVIGGADGLDDSIRAKAERLIAFGAVTWPHMLVRAMLAEQLYRAMTILSGHPYHRA